MISGILKGAVSFGTKLLISMGSEKLIEWMFWYVAKEIVKTTKTKHDDEFLEQIMKAYKEKE